VQFRTAVVSVRMRTYVGSSNQRSASRKRGRDAPDPRFHAKPGPAGLERKGKLENRNGGIAEDTPRFRSLESEE